MADVVQVAHVRAAAGDTKITPVDYHAGWLIMGNVFGHMTADGVHITGWHETDFVLAAGSNYFISDVFDLLTQGFGFVWRYFAIVFYKTHVRVVGTT